MPQLFGAACFLDRHLTLNPSDRYPPESRACVGSTIITVNANLPFAGRELAPLSPAGQGGRVTKVARSLRSGGLTSNEEDGV